MTLHTDRQSGLLTDVLYIASPNCDDRPAGTAIDLLVIHGISLPAGQFGGPYITQLFTNRINPDDHPTFRELAGLKVSAHVLIRRDGEVIQYVPFTRRAWHAGVSQYEGRKNCNDFSIGIELEGTDEQPYSSIQYDRLADVTVSLLATYPALTSSRITGHSNIAPGRKTDPGPAFDWTKFHDLLSAKLG